MSGELYDRLRVAVDELVRAELRGGVEISGLLFVVLCKFVLEAKALVDNGFKPDEAVLMVLDYYLGEELDEILDALEKASEDLKSGKLK